MNDPFTTFIEFALYASITFALIVGILWLAALVKVIFKI